MRYILLRMSDVSHNRGENAYIGAVEVFSISKLILVMVARRRDGPFIEEGEGRSYRTVRNSSKMKLGTCASATWKTRGNRRFRVNQVQDRTLWDRCSVCGVLCSGVSFLGTANLRAWVQLHLFSRHELLSCCEHFYLRALSGRDQWETDPQENGRNVCEETHSSVFLGPEKAVTGVLKGGRSDVELGDVQVLELNIFGR